MKPADLGLSVSDTRLSAANNNPPLYHRNNNNTLYYEYIIVKTLTPRSEVTSLSYLRVLVTSVVSTQTCRMFIPIFDVCESCALYFVLGDTPVANKCKTRLDYPSRFPPPCMRRMHIAHSSYSASD